MAGRRRAARVVRVLEQLVTIYGRPQALGSLRGESSSWSLFFPEGHKSRYLWLMEHNRRRSRFCLSMVVYVALVGTAAAGPIDVDQLSLKRSGDRQRLSFSSHDESWILPATAAPDDGPGAISFELFSAADPSGQTLGIPQLAAPAVWRVSHGPDGSIVRFRLRNTAAPNAAGDFS